VKIITEIAFFLAVQFPFLMNVQFLEERATIVHGAYRLFSLIMRVLSTYIFYQKQSSFKLDTFSVLYEMIITSDVLTHAP
jgi:hypothetical protein